MDNYLQASAPNETQNNVDDESTKVYDIVSGGHDVALAVDFQVFL